MKKIFFSYIILLCFVSAYSQNISSAEKILNEISNVYKSKSTIYMKFKNELKNTKTNTVDNFKGEIYIKGDKFNLNIPKLDIKQIYDGNKLYTISDEQQEITVSSPKSNDDILLTPTKIFEIYKTGFNISLDKTKNKGKLIYVKLTPHKKNDIIHVLIGIDKTKKQLVEITELTKNNTTTTIRIEKQLENIIIPKSLLNFDKKFYKDYYISEI